MAAFASTFALAACSLQHSSAPGPDLARIRSIVDDAIIPVMAEHQVPGMAVAVTIDGRALLFNYGVASTQTAVPVDEATLFELGSVSKPFTAILSAHAHALGKLSLDDTPGDHVPELRGTALDRVTLLHLGTYTAGGLPLQFPTDVSGRDGMIRYFTRWVPDAEPGVQRRYSNPSIGLLGYITGRVFGTDFSEAVESHLFATLGLRRTHVRMPEEAWANYAWGHDAAGNPVRMRPGLFDAEAYGIRSTAADMIRFVQANIDPSGLPPDLRQAIEMSQRGYFESGALVQGLGWERYPYPVSLELLLAGNSEAMMMKANAAIRLEPPRLRKGAVLLNKTGSTAGFGAFVVFVPEQRIGIVMLANRNLPIPARIRAAHEMLERLAAMPR